MIRLYCVYMSCIVCVHAIKLYSNVIYKDFDSQDAFKECVVVSANVRPLEAIVSDHLNFSRQTTRLLTGAHLLEGLDAP